ncbi:hypothetical protein Vafri_505, partial [Volvox africanus]
INCVIYKYFLLDSSKNIPRFQPAHIQILCHLQLNCFIAFTMTIKSGIMNITVEFAKDLKSGDWFGKQDPYCILRVGGQTFRTHTVKCGGRNPIWNETFRVNIVDENDVSLDIKDEDLGRRDDLIGNATFSFSRARYAGNDRQEVAVFSPKSRRQHGFVSVSLKWTPHRVPTELFPQHSQRAAVNCTAAQQQICYVIATAPPCQQQTDIDASSMVYGNSLYQQTSPPQLVAGPIMQAVVYQPVFVPLEQRNNAIRIGDNVRPL